MKTSDTWKHRSREGRVSLLFYIVEQFQHDGHFPSGYSVLH